MFLTLYTNFRGRELVLLVEEGAGEESQGSTLLYETLSNEMQFLEGK